MSTFDRACKTPGAVFATHLHETTRVAAAVTLPFSLGLDEAAAKALEDAIHDALEMVLAPYYGDESLGTAEMDAA